jgi:predicted permease
MVSAVLSGMLPAWHAARPDRGSTFMSARTTQRSRVRGALIAAEVTLSLILLAGAGLLIKSFIRLLAVDPGFQTQHLLTIEIELPGQRYRDVQQRSEFVSSALQRLARIPGVTAAAATNVMPLTRSSVVNGFSLAGSSQKMGSAGFRAVTPGYFETMGITLARGRLPRPGDAGIGVINHAMAHRFWPNDDPVGKEIETARMERVRTSQGWTMRVIPERFRVIGIVGDVRHLTLDLAPEPEMYLLYSQMATSDFTLVLRSTTDAGMLTRKAQREILAVDHEQPLAGVHTMDQLIAQDVSDRRFVLLLLAVFASVAVVLASAGIFAVVSHSVSQRTREIGIRMALGANAASVVGAMVRQTLGWVAAGLVLGVAGSLATGRVLSAYLFSVEPRDPGALAMAAIFMAAIGSLAAFLPARSAARVDPVNTLRCE